VDTTHEAIRGYPLLLALLHQKLAPGADSADRSAPGDRQAASRTSFASTGKIDRKRAEDVLRRENQVIKYERIELHATSLRWRSGTVRSAGESGYRGVFRGKGRAAVPLSPEFPEELVEHVHPCASSLLSGRDYLSRVVAHKKGSKNRGDWTT
jgi:hypothetical protein